MALKISVGIKKNTGDGPGGLSLSGLATSINKEASRKNTTTLKKSRAKIATYSNDDSSDKKDETPQQPPTPPSLSEPSIAINAQEYIQKQNAEKVKKQLESDDPKERMAGAETALKARASGLEDTFYGNQLKNNEDTQTPALFKTVAETYDELNPDLTNDEKKEGVRNIINDATDPKDINDPSCPLHDDAPALSEILSDEFPTELEELTVTPTQTEENPFEKRTDTFSFVNEFGDTVYMKITDEKLLDDINKVQEELEKAQEKAKEIQDKIDKLSSKEPLTKEEQETLEKLQKELEKTDVGKLQAQVNELKNKALKNAQELYASGQDDLMQEYNSEQLEQLSAWDPRLSRADAFYMSEGTSVMPIIVPMSSITAASAIDGLVFKQHRLFASTLQQKYEENNLLNGHNKGADTDVVGPYIAPNTDTVETTTDAVTSETSVGDHQTYHPGAIPIAFNTTKYYQEPGYYGVASLMNCYSITKLIGGLDTPEMVENTGVRVRENFMYDVRDQRRFYGLSVGKRILTNGDETSQAEAAKAQQQAEQEFQNVLEVSNPTLRNIIHWSNQDLWGRTPYSYQDFVFSKWYGLIPNNRLLTLRRYHAPVSDNIQFDGMAIPDGETTYETTSAFSPRCTVVTYIGEDTGNKFSELLKFSSGLGWKDAESKIWNVDGEEGDDPQGKIDQMFEGGGYGAADCGGLVGKFLGLGNTFTSKFLSFTKMTGLMTGSINVGLSQGAFDNLSKANKDPYADDTFENRIQGPINRIQTVKRRTEGITFEQSFNVKCTYVAKSIGGINPKAAMLDILANCMEMVSADAVFWGGGHRFNIQPKLYPYHDGGFRDSFMKKLFDGKIFGNGGAIDAVLSGIKKLGSGGTGDFWSNITSSLETLWGNLSGAVGSIVGSLTGSLFGEGTGNALSTFFSGLSNNEKAKADGAKFMGNLGKNLNKMWKNKVMEQTAVPSIKGMASLLIGEPVGEWHLTVGNPLNPIMVVGNLICEKMDVSFSDELGPDDFPEEMTVTYTLQHGMPRDKSAIQSMFNRGMGKIYDLPDYIKSSSDFETMVDHYTGGRVSSRTPEWLNTASFTNKQIKQQYGSVKRYQGYAIDEGHVPSNHGNPNTSLITKFTPLPYGEADIIGNAGKIGANPNISIIKGLQVTRKYSS